MVFVTVIMASYYFMKLEQNLIFDFIDFIILTNVIVEYNQHRIPDLHYLCTISFE